MKKEITIKTFFITAAVGIILIMIILISNTLGASRRILSTTEDAVSAVSTFYLEGMADRRAKTISNLIDSNFDHMEKAVNVIRNEGITSQEELRRTIGAIKSLLSLNGFALVDEDNVVYTQYTTYTGGSRHEFLSGELTEKNVVSTVYLYGSSKQLCLAIPIEDLDIMGKSFKACFVQIDIRDIVDLLAFDDQGETSFALYSKNGGNLSDTDLGPLISDQNIFESTKAVVAQDDWNEMLTDFAEEKEGDMILSFEGAKETLCYVPVRDTGWELAVLIRESVIRDQISGISENNLAISRRLILLTLISVLLLAAVLLLMLRHISKNRLEAEMENSRTFRSMANTDSLTGVRNKHSYSEYEQFLNQKIQENEIRKLAVVVCDINGLKHVNDTRGHAAGDQLIKDASAMICEYFIHGSVYRIGGDEFVVLLQDKGFDTMTEVMEDFNRKVEENIAEDSVVISIGYSTLKPEDIQLHDVFERADKMMYDRKKELKAMGAITRE